MGEAESQLSLGRIEEIRGCKENDVFYKLPEGTKKLNVRWVDSWKSGPMGTKTIKLLGRDAFVNPPREATGTEDGRKRSGRRGQRMVFDSEKNPS